ncbi:Clr6 histone deacetylase associated PHD protein-2 Cph2 [Oleoguttula sp. CCFEE 5521]
MEHDMAWQGGFASTFDAQLGQNNEDWEDWLRWDPAAGDQTSPDMGFSSNAGSSKHDSPVQDPVFPASSFDVLNGTIAPPLIVSDEGMDFSNGLGDGGFAFGMGGAAGESFSFDPALMDQMNMESTIKPYQMNVPMPMQPIAAPEEQALLSALSADPSFSQGTLNQAPAPSTTEHSPASSNSKRTSLSSQTSPDPPPKKKGGRKRKVDAVEKEPVDDGELQYDEDGRPIKKTSHNVIEKRYRNNLNDKIVALRNSVPALRAMSRINAGDDSEDLEGLAPAHKLNKATVMAKATEYIKHLEKRNNTMQDDMNALKARLAAVEATINQSRERSASMSISPPSGTMRPREMSKVSQPAQTYLNMPTQRQHQQYAQQQSPPNYNRPPNPPAEAQNQQGVRGGRGGMMNKLMLGSMAGLMVMEGYTESSGSSSDGSSRGLFAVPGMDRLVRRGMPSPEVGPLSTHTFMPLFKLLLVLGAVIYLIAPLLAPRPKAKQAARTHVRLPKAPSLASPVEVRRKAWLTAVQSVWIPKHFLLEVYAVASKKLKLSIRRLIGAETYTMLTGLNSEEEAARIKAWDIAIDAQLAGGDAEVSYYRLLLTLMASGTLPDSPTRLMQKAVHFRVFFWDVANAGYGNLIYWDSARKQQKELLHAKQHGRPTAEDEVDLLPDHLARLVELDCDEVLGDEMIQRAWNLAWNKPSAHALVHNAARDSVVEDHAIRSPLDAVAAWYSNILVDETLADTLSTRHSKIDMEYYLGLAVSVAPPASGTEARSLAAKAVLSNTNREANIITALECLPASSPTSPSMNIVSHAPASPEVRTALTIAKLIALSVPTTSPAAKLSASQSLGRLIFAPEHFTLLTAVASARLMQVMTADRHATSPIDHGVENIACNLRVWVGTVAGRSSGLHRSQRNRVVEKVNTKPAAGTKSAGGKKAGKVTKKYIINATQPVNDRIFDAGAYTTFLQQRIKVDGRTANLGDNITVSNLGDGRIEVVSHQDFSGRYLKYLTKKFLKKQQLRDWLRVVSTNKGEYSLKFFNVVGEEGDEDED